MRSRLLCSLLGLCLLTAAVPRAFALVQMHPDLEAELRAKGAYRAVIQQLMDARSRGAIQDGRAGGPLKVDPGKKVTWNAIIILVDFDDNPANGAYDAADFSDMLVNSGTWPSGSMRDYYTESSYGKFTFTGDVVGWYRMPENYSYYSNQDGVNGTADDNGFGNYPNNAQRLYEDAVAAADPDVNFQNYRNGNATVEGVFVVHAGPGAETTGNADDVWSHRSSGTVATADGTSCTSYTHQPELQGGGIATIGVFAHEFGHSLGLPDLYDTDGSSSGLGRWCMMAGGTWNGGGATPAHFSAWCKRTLGWALSNDVTTNTAGVVLTSATDGDDQIRLVGDTHVVGEYLLLEVRRQNGFDAALPSDGLLVWHVHDGIGGNQSEACEPPAISHPVVRLLQADGLCQLEAGTSSGNAGDPFPGTTNNTRASALTFPSTRAYNGKKSGLVLDNIQDLGANVQLDIELDEILQLNVPLDYATLDDALELSGKNDEIRLEAGHAPVGDWRILDGFTISGGWDPTFTTQDPQNPSVIDGGGILQTAFQVNGAATPFRLDNLIVRNGFGERTFTPNAYKGGAVFMTGGAFEATRTRFEANQAGLNGTLPGLGGALAFENTEVTLTDCVFDGNLAQEGGALHAIGGSVTLVRTSFLNHDLFLPPVDFEQRGGAVLLEGASLADTDGLYQGNSADDGGAIYVTGAAASFTNTRVESNVASDDGGGILVENGDVTADGLQVVDNDAAGEGGGLYADTGLFDLRRVVATGNASGTLGGGLFLGDASAGSRVGSSVIADNTASIIVGGLLVSGGEMTVEHNTFHHNTGTVASGALQTSSAAVWVRNNIFSESVGSAYTFAGGTLHQLDFNDWWMTTGAPDVSGATKGVSSTSHDPVLVDPAGGDYHLGVGSRAIDRGDPGLPADFDGSPPDMGAYGGADDDGDRPAAPAEATVEHIGSDSQLDWSYPGVGTAPTESRILYDYIVGLPKEPLFVGLSLATVPAPTTTYLHLDDQGASYQIQLVDANGHAGSYTDLLDPFPDPVPGLGVFAVGDPTPNPFNPTTTIQLSLPTASRVRAEVYDLAGRRVRVLADHQMDAGSHLLRWNGRDGRGHAVASGSYVFRLSSAAGQATRRLLLIK